MFGILLSLLRLVGDLEGGVGRYGLAQVSLWRTIVSSGRTSRSCSRSAGLSRLWFSFASRLYTLMSRIPGGMMLDFGISK